MEPELEDGEVKFCPDCNMLVDPFLTYCPNCGTLAHIRQTQTEPPRLMLSRCAVYLAGGFSFLCIFVNLIGAVVIVGNIPFTYYVVANHWEDWIWLLGYGIPIFFGMFLLLSYVGALYGYEAGHKRWNAKRLTIVVFSVRFLILLGSLNLLLGFVYQGILIPASRYGSTEVLMIPHLLWATGAFMILLSLPGLIIATRWLKREEAEASYILG